MRYQILAVSLMMVAIGLIGPVAAAAQTNATHSPRTLVG